MTYRSGSDHPNWKGDRAGYAALHSRVRKLRGGPRKCEVCGTTNPAKRYEWANLTGNYADPQDYARMCVFHHRMFDRTRRRIADGEPYDAEHARAIFGRFAPLIEAAVPA